MTSNVIDGDQSLMLPPQNRRGVYSEGAHYPSISTLAEAYLVILCALHDAWAAIPADREGLRRDLEASLKTAMADLLAECKALGVPPQGYALRDLIRHRELFPDDLDPRLEPAILDSATVIQELCHDGPKPKLGVASDQLAALTRL